MDYQSKSLENFNDEKGSITHFGTRLEVILNTAKGLMMIQDKYYHCDLKDNNVLLQELTPVEKLAVEKLDETELGQEPNVPLVMQLYSNRYFVVQIIDIGNDKMIKNFRKCQISTPGHAPSEFLQEDSETASFNDEKFDVFGLFIIFLNMEFFNLDYESFSHYNSIYYSRYSNLVAKGQFQQESEEIKYKEKTLNKFLKTKQGMDDFKERKMFKMIETILIENDQKNKNLETFKSSVKVVYPDFEKNSIDKIKKENELRKTKNQTLLENKNQKKSEQEKPSKMTSFSLENMIFNDLQHLNLIMFGAYYFMIENEFFNILLQEIDCDSKDLKIPLLKFNKSNELIITKENELNKLQDDQKYWVRKYELDYQMGEIRQKILLEGIKMLTVERKDRMTIKETLDYLQDQ